MSSVEESLALRQSHLNIIYAYADALDRRDWAKLESIFTNNARFLAQHVPHYGAEPIEIVSLSGQREVVEGISAFFPALRATHHSATNEVIERIDTNRASAICYIRAFHLGAGSRAHLFEESLARFSFYTVRQDEVWKVERLQEDILIMLGTTEVFGSVSLPSTPGEEA